MRIHSLEFSAIGPFPGTERIDFERLNQAGLFLLSGPTGAGKSTIFDAICFALYGSTSRSSGSGSKGMHSDFAQPGNEPYVAMEFSVGGYRYRIRRTPEWLKPSTRAKAGWSKQHATVLLSRCPTDAWSSEDESPWEVLSYRIDETATLILGIFGLTLQQFSQVVMLPQGDFARFLTASSNDREELLAKLFPIDLYRDLRDVLKDRAGEAEEAVNLLASESESARREVITLLERLDVGQDAAGQQATSESINLDQTAKLLETARQEAAERRRELGESVTDARRRAERLERSVDEWAEHDRLLERKRRVDEAAKTLSNRKATVRAAQAAQPVTESFERWRKACAETANKRDQLGHVVSSMREVAVEPMRLSGENESDLTIETRYWEDPFRLNSEHDDAYGALLDRRKESLRQIQQRYAEVDELALAIKDPTRRLEEARRQEERTAQRIESVQNSLLQIDQEAADARKDAERLSDLSVARTETDAILTVTRRAADVRVQCHEAERDLERAERNRREASERVNVLMEQRFRQAVMVLADDLTEESPCPVCGSLEHPRPATESQGESPVEIGQEEIDRASQQRERAEASVRQVGELLAGLRKSLDELQAQGALGEVSAAEESYRQANLAYETVQERVQRLGDLEKKQADLQGTLQAEQDNAHRLALEKSGLASRIEELARRHDALNATLAESPDREKVHSMSSRVDQLKSMRAEAAMRRAQLETAATFDADLESTYRKALEKSPFRDQEHVSESELSHDELEALEESIRGDEQEFVRWDEAWKASWHQRFLERLEEDHERPDADTVEESRRAATAAAERHEESVIRETKLRDGLDNVLRVAERDRILRRESEDALTKAQMLKDLSDVAAGLGSENLQKMPLTTFILAAQLEEIADAATVRLLAMTDGRYSLRHTDASAGNNKKSGLGLEVFDAWTSEARPTTSLSGGETFMASLCLALGLADVVQARSGGIEIDTLFVDEGFGSLDEDTLEGVMDAIDGLRENGRVIGLVSHVADMKTRIPEHVKIKRAPQGSSVESTTA